MKEILSGSAVPRIRLAAIGIAAMLGLASAGICAAQRNPEPGGPGEPLPGMKPGTALPKPYLKGVRVLGHQPLGGRVGDEQQAWVDHCAYVSNVPFGFQGIEADSRSGVAVIDVSDPKEPRLVGQLRERGALRATETMAAVDLPNRRLLVAGDYAGGNPSFSPNDPPVLDIYDVTDCTKPKLLSEFVWPENVHTLTFSPDGRRIYAPSITQPPLGTGGLHVLDVSDPAHPRYVGRFKATGPDGNAWDFGAHEVSISADERRIYAGVIASLGGDLNDGKPLKLQQGGGNEHGGIYIFDNSDLVLGRPSPKLRLIGTAQRAGWHSVAQANIAGVPFLVGAGEAGNCPGAFPRITSIADETKPVLVGEFRLFTNQPEHCAGLQDGQTTTSHFADVDSPVDTRLGLFNFEQGGGLRIVDLRNPARPTEVAYFRPGDGCTGHVRYQRDSGQIWLVCWSTGFWVLELSPEIRRALDMPMARKQEAAAP